MKHTVKLGAAKALVIETKREGVQVEMSIAGVVMASGLVEPATAELLSWAFERAAQEAQAAAQGRAAA